MLSKARSHKVGAVLVLQSPHFYVNRRRIADLARAERIATIFQDDSYVSAGGLISYGPSVTDAWARVAYFIDRLLKGAKAGDLPVEQPDSYRLVVNLTTATALGIGIPELALLRADEVIR